MGGIAKPATRTWIKTKRKYYVMYCVAVLGVSLNLRLYGCNLVTDIKSNEFGHLAGQLIWYQLSNKQSRLIPLNKVTALNRVVRVIDLRGQVPAKISAQLGQGWTPSTTQSKAQSSR